MSAKVRLGSKLPGDEDFNGIDHMAAELVANPEKIRCLYVEVDVSKIVDDTDTGARVPYLRVRRAEYVGPADQVGKDLRRMFEQKVQDRTGRQPMDFDAVPEGGDDAAE